MNSFDARRQVLKLGIPGRSEYLVSLCSRYLPFPSNPSERISTCDSATTLFLAKRAWMVPPPAGAAGPQTAEEAFSKAPGLFIPLGSLSPFVFLSFFVHFADPAFSMLEHSAFYGVLAQTSEVNIALRARMNGWMDRVSGQAR